MESLIDSLPIFDGAITAFQVYMLLQLKALYKEIEAERKHNISAYKRTKERLEKLDSRLRNLEMKAAKHWSSHRYTD